MTSPLTSSDLYGALGASNVTAVLGPTNTGKTHLAIERMLGHQSGLIGLPLRLLAREVYDKIVARIGPSDVALITGEEKIKPKNARYWISTVEAMPRELEVEFVAIDEIQLAADPERGHVFTDRIFHMRGTKETLLLGAETMRTPLANLLPGLNFISRPRLSNLSYAGPKKLSRLPRRTAIVAFSVQDVYEVAELIRRQRGGAAVVLGALSPRTRNAQVEMFQSGDVDFLVATDAIGMGLNLDVHHVAFAGSRKFDGINHRDLTPAEIGQIAGRAGRHIKDGTFGVTGDVHPFDSDLINRIENHDFDPVTNLQWRARTLDFASVPRLLASLKLSPNKPFLQKARDADDVLALESLATDKSITDFANGPVNVQRLWEVCQVPDYRRIGIGEHSDLVRQLFHFIKRDEGLIPVDWISEKIDQHDRTDGDIDTIATRLAHIRTWTFIANRVDWLADPTYWQGRTREIEDRLSDALHEGLTKRFVDQRTSTLMKRLRDQDELYVEIDDLGQILVEDHLLGKISGFLFTPDSESKGVDGRAARAAATQVLTKELAMRSEQLLAAEINEFSFSATGEIIWGGDVVGRLQKGDHILKPTALLIADENLNGPVREELTAKLQSVAEQIIADKLSSLVNLNNAQELSGMARGIAFQLAENLGVLLREPIANDIRQLDQEARRQLRKFGVRFGAFNIYFPLLLKPGPAELSRLLWLIFNDNLDKATEWVLPRAGLTSAIHDSTIDVAYYRSAGFHVCGGRVVRLDMLERLADQIRPLVAWRAPKATDKKTTNTDSSTATGTGTDTDTNVAELKADGDEKEAAANVDAEKDEAQPAETPALKTETESAAPNSQVGKTEADGSDTEAPVGATGDGGFMIIPEMMSIMGCSAKELSEVLRALGFVSDVVVQQAETAKDDQQEATVDTEASSEADDNTEIKTEAESEAPLKAEAEPVNELLIWRPRKRAGQGGRGHGGRSHGGRSQGGRNQNGRNRANDNSQSGNQERGGAEQGKFKHEKGGKRRHGKPSGKGHHQAGRGHKPAQPPREKKIDPDSPFAKLQVLKDKIEDKAG